MITTAIEGRYQHRPEVKPRDVARGTFPDYAIQAPLAAYHKLVDDTEALVTGPENLAALKSSVVALNAAGDAIEAAGTKFAKVVASNHGANAKVHVGAILGLSEFTQAVNGVDALVREYGPVAWNPDPIMRGIRELRSGTDFFLQRGYTVTDR